MSKDPAVTCISGLDPQALECSIIYLKEKLEYAAESFDGSASYNMKQAHRMQFAISFLWASILIPIKVILSSDNVSTLIIVCIFYIILFTFIILNCYRSYKLYSFTHEHAYSRIKRIQADISCIENSVGSINQADIEDIYKNYRSVYDDTNRILESKQFINLKMISESLG